MTDRGPTPDFRYGRLQPATEYLANFLGFRSWGSMTQFVLDQGELNLAIDVRAIPFPNPDLFDELCALSGIGRTQWVQRDNVLRLTLSPIISARLAA